MSAPESQSAAAPEPEKHEPPASEVAAQTAAEQPVDEGVPEYEPLTPELVEEEAIRGDFVLKWAVVLLAFLLGSTRIGETPTLVHVKSGQYMASHGLLPPRTDVFSYTATEYPWVNLSWGFDLLSAAAYGIGGFAGLSVLKGLIAALAFGFLVHIYRPSLPLWGSSVCAAAALVAFHPRLTAQPGIITLLGIAVTLWLLDVWRRTGYQRKWLWWLVPVFVVWGNLDSRMFLGLLLLLLYAVGDQTESLVTKPRDESRLVPPNARKQLWITLGLCLVASLAHPFGWRAPLGALHVYGTEYPAFREAVGSPSPAMVQYFSLIESAFWSNLNIATSVALLLLVAACVLFVKNNNHRSFAEMSVFAGFVFLGLMTTYELPIAAVVAGALAAVNGQDWYRDNCRQTYTIEIKELLWSRGGRALTVLAFALLAFFDIGGRLRDATAPRTGFGLDKSLAAIIDGLDSQLKESYGRPFNFVPAQGDMLIWLGKEPFLDGRLALYRGNGGRDDLIATFLHTRDALRIHKFNETNQIVQKSNKELADAQAAWQKTFDKYGVTHVLPRLASSGSAPDYFSLFDLWIDEQYWQLTDFGAATAIFYRADKTDDAPLNDFRAKHKVDFIQTAFRTQPELITTRNKWASPPSFYDNYVWKKPRFIPNEIRRAMHLVRASMEPSLPAKVNEARLGLVLLAVRSAQAGLDKAPDCVEGYVVLGDAYSLLSKWEKEGMMTNRGPPRIGLRYFQAAAAYGQAITAEPDNEAAHTGAFALYYTEGKLDLALRERNILNAKLASQTPRNVDEVQRQQQAFHTAEELESLSAEVDQELAQLQERGADLLQLAQYASQRGCIGKALTFLSKDPEMTRGNLEMQRMHALFLLEAGFAETAFEASGLMEEPAKMAALARWREVAALVHLAIADYDRANQLWNEAAAEAEKTSLGRLLVNLLPELGMQMRPWPIDAATSAEDFLYQRPEVIAGLKLLLALAQIERGQIEQATGNFRAVLDIDPEHAARPIIGYYLRLITGTDEVDPLPPSERVPVLFEPEAE